MRQTMNTPACEQVQIAAMAIADGERPDLTTEEIRTHIATCQSCREEIAAMTAMNDLFASHMRRAVAGDVWPQVAEQIAAPQPVRSASATEWRALGIGVALLAVYKIIELAPDEAPALLLRMVPVVIAIALLFVLKENPFTINSKLTLEGE
jgi:anti-sigma factor RsiW